MVWSSHHNSKPCRFHSPSTIVKMTCLEPKSHYREPRASPRTRVSVPINLNKLNKTKAIIHLHRPEPNLLPIPIPIPRAVVSFFPTP